VNEAAAIFADLGDTGWLPHVLDTHALILLDDGRADEALEMVQSAIEIFIDGEDSSGLVDSMWTKCLAFIRLNKKQEALRTFIDLQNIASSKIGNATADKYAEKLAAELSRKKKPPGGGPRYNARAMRIRGREESPDEKNVRTAAAPVWIDSAALAPLGIEVDSIMAISMYGGVSAGTRILFSREGTIGVGTVGFESLSGMYFVMIDNFPALLSDVQIIGVIAGYCPAEAFADKTRAFEPLPFPAR
jgi:hypothetical protein